MNENEGIFEEKIGGMGMKGVIVRERIRIMKVGQMDVEERIVKLENIDEYLDMDEEEERKKEYEVEWVEKIQRGKKEGSGVIIKGNNEGNGKRRVEEERVRIGVKLEINF